MKKYFLLFAIFCATIISSCEYDNSNDEPIVAETYSASFEDGRSIILHKPHPGNVIKSYAMKLVYDKLVQLGVITND